MHPEQTHHPLLKQKREPHASRPLIFHKSALDKISTKPPSLHPNRELLAVNNQYPLGQQTGRAERCHIFCKYTFNHTATFIPCDSPCKKPLLSIISKLPQCVCISVLILHGNRVITSHKRLIFFSCPVDFQYTFLQKIGAFLIRHQYPANLKNRFRPFEKHHAAIIILATGNREQQHCQRQESI